MFCVTASKLKCYGYRSISLLSNIDNNLEQLIYSKIHSFFEKVKVCNQICIFMNANVCAYVICNYT